jgi:hypothetical protein
MARDTFESKDEVDIAARPDGLANALVIVTFFALLLAFYLVEKGLKDKYNGGMFKDANAERKATP